MSEFKRESEQIVDTVRRSFPDVRLIYLYGSHVSGSARPDSDFDIAFLPEQKTALESRWKTQTELGGVLHAAVDLVDLMTAPTVLRKEIVAGGKVLYEKNRYERDSFEMTALSMYAHLQEERREILADFTGGTQ